MDDRCKRCGRYLDSGNDCFNSVEEALAAHKCPMPSEQTTPSRAEQTVCVCGHTKRAHYFGDEMHTACQQEGCRCREYLSLVPVAPPPSTERDRIEELADRVREGIAADDRQTRYEFDEACAALRELAKMALDALRDAERLDRERTINKLHREGFKRIREFLRESPPDVSRAILWCGDSLSGYTDGAIDAATLADGGTE